jgi:hypothetical protein
MILETTGRDTIMGTRKLSQRTKEAQSNLIRTLTLDEFRKQFAAEIIEIDKLRPINLMADRDGFLFELANIVRLARKRHDKSYQDRILGSIRAAELAAADIEKTLNGLAELDIDQLEGALIMLREASIYDHLPQPRLIGLFQFLDRARLTLLLLNTLMKCAPGMPDISAKRGRPASLHGPTALALIDLWEAFTAEERDGTPHRAVTRVPTPKMFKAAGRGRIEAVTKQFSTLFIIQAFRMIDNGIKNSEIVTAIRHGLSLQKTRAQILQTSKGAGLAKIIDTLARHNDSQRKS